MTTSSDSEAITHNHDLVWLEPNAEACEECGSRFNLRVCTDCGHVGCCESQQGHNTAHWRVSGHPVIKSMPVGQGSFTWCYECRKYL